MASRKEVAVIVVADLVSNVEPKLKPNKLRWFDRGVGWHNGPRSK